MASSYALLLLAPRFLLDKHIESVSSFRYCQEHGLYLTLLPWFQLLYGAGHVFTVYIMGC